jgi:hypothetical protein
MRQMPSLTFTGALRILGVHDSKTVRTLDKVLGSAILGAGFAAALGGFPLAPVALLAGVWGWVDQKDQAIRLLQGLVNGVSG